MSIFALLVLAIAILPAFGSFTGLADVEPAPGTFIYAVAGDHVIPISSSE